MGRNKGRVSGGRSSLELSNRLCFRQTYRATSVRQDGKGGEHENEIEIDRPGGLGDDSSAGGLPERQSTNYRTASRAALDESGGHQIRGREAPRGRHGSARGNGYGPGRHDAGSPALEHHRPGQSFFGRGI